MAGNRIFSPEFRVWVAERMKNGESPSALSNELKIKRSILYRWREAYREAGSRRAEPPPWASSGVLTTVSPDERRSRSRGRRPEDCRTGTQGGAISPGERFFKKSLQASKESTLDQQRAWRGALFGEVMQLEGKSELPVVQACDAAPQPGWLLPALG